MKSKWLYAISIILISVYVFCIAIAFKSEYTHSYKLYYIEGKTRWWTGYDGLIINLNKKYNIDIKEGYQYLGRDFKYIINEDTNAVEKVEFDGDSTIYYQIKKEDLNKKYSIIVSVENIEGNNIKVQLNGEKKDLIYNGNSFKIEANKSQEYNELNVKVSKNVEMISISFMENIYE